MAKLSEEKFKEAYRQEKDLRVARRMLAVNMALYKKESTQHVADSLMQCPNWVLKWVGRFEEGGMAALRDLPGAGRPSRIKPKTMEKIMDDACRGKTTPKQVRQKILDRAGIRFHVTYVRKLMRGRNLTVKRVTRVHVRHADAGTVNSWRHRLKRRIPRLKKDRFVIAMADEAFFVRDDASGRKYWSKRGTRIKIPYSGSRQRLTLFGAVTDTREQIFRSSTGGFNNRTFIPFVRSLLRRFKKVAPIPGKASAHRSKMLRKKFGKNKNIKFIYLPTASPYLNPAEQCWSKGKNEIMNSEYRETFADLRNRVSEYYRTTKFNFDIYKYINRKTSEYA
ncbi:MAG: IS630 family transposase [Thaumarchaeota archaeon]|nr:IS630 family transposase [Nitrososphaerota archaeon]